MSSPGGSNQAAQTHQQQSATSAVIEAGRASETEPSTVVPQQQSHADGVHLLGGGSLSHECPTRGPLPRATFESLAAVALQLALHCLDTNSRLVARRCSRRLLHAASQPFAWRHASPLTATASGLAAVPLGWPLLSLIPLSLRLEGDADSAHVALIARRLQSASARELHVHRDAALRLADWELLLGWPGSQSLRLVSAPAAVVPTGAMRSSFGCRGCSRCRVGRGPRPHWRC